MKHFQIFCLLFVLGMFAACSTTPSGTAQSATQDIAIPSKVTAKAPPPATKSDNTYNNPEIGFSITKPSEWHFLPIKTEEATRDTARFDDAELDGAFHKEHNDKVPLVAFARYPRQDLFKSPTVMVGFVNMRPNGMPPRDVLNGILASWGIADHRNDLVFVDEVQDREVDGVTSAYARVKHTGDLNDGQKFSFMTRLLVVPRGKMRLLVLMIRPLKDSEVSEEAFDEILSSIKIAQ